MRSIFMFLFALCSFGFAACDGRAEAGAAETPPEHTYTVRGEIRRLPSQEAPRREIFVKHERIPDYVGASGTVEPMPAMTMPFEPAPGESLEGLQVGDEIEFTYEVWWSGKPRDRIREIKKLPAGTVKF